MTNINLCDKCLQMTNHRDGVCLKCSAKKSIPEIVEELMNILPISHKENDSKCCNSNYNLKGVYHGRGKSQECNCEYEEYKKEITTTLETQEAQWKEETAGVVREILSLPQIELETDDKEMGQFLHSVDLDDIKAIAQAHGINLSDK
jgi:hypothetical protein